MKTRAAVLWGPEKPWSVEEIDLDEPRTGEVLVRMTASGLCHSDEHFRDGTNSIGYPFIGGHEGRGSSSRSARASPTLSPATMSSSASYLPAVSAAPAPGECRAYATAVRRSAWEPNSRTAPPGTAYEARTPG